MRFGKMQVNFTVGDADSVIVDVKAKVTSTAELDKLVAALEASRPLLPTPHPEDSDRGG